MPDTPTAAREIQTWDADDNIGLMAPLRWRSPRVVEVTGDMLLDRHSRIDLVIGVAVATLATGRRHTFLVNVGDVEALRTYLASDRVWADYISDRAYNLTHDDDLSCAVANSINGLLGDGRNSGWPPANILWGTTVRTQAEADERLPVLLECPGRRWVDIKGPREGISLDDYLPSDESQCCPECGGDVGCNSDGSWICIHVSGVVLGCGWEGPEADVKPSLEWVRVSGASGPDTWPTHPAWVRSIRDQCKAVEVGFRFDSWGDCLPVDKPWEQDSPKPKRKGEIWWNQAGGQGFHGDEVWRMRRVGKARSGRTLDGKTHDDLPEVVAHA